MSEQEAQGPSPADAAEAARADVARLMQSEVELSHRRAAQLFEIRNQQDGGCALAGELVNDPGALAAAAERVTHAAAEVVAAASAIAAARRAREAAIVRFNRLEADVKREEAAQLRQRADAIDEQGRPHLLALRELYGVDFVSKSSVSAYIGAALRAVPVAAGAAGTIPEGLRAQAAELEADADRLNTQTVRRAGQAVGANAAELYAAITQNPFCLGPTLDEVHEWVASAEPAARTPWRVDRLSRHLPVDDEAWRAAGPQFILTWDPRGIVAGSSSVSVPRERDANGVVLSRNRPRAYSV